MPDTRGSEIHESVAPQPVETTIVKHFPNSFRDTHLLQHLKEIEVEEVVLCGAMSHMCIDATPALSLTLGFSALSLMMLVQRETWNTEVKQLRLPKFMSFYGSTSNAFCKSYLYR
ncbi:isochorismatase family protein [Stenomitos frigidus AS-A4]|uniref:Isochorismatase family protein n=1 Tax=Stenomitos frigidus AS-A4 TaxID=2933935 RepID=A0ABV0KVV9_9CYAN|nr:isochorismatase family protein [Phormidium sp. FACHB-592]